MNRIINRILEDYKLHPEGIHGVDHWMRVLENGKILTDETGADSMVVSLFAVLHDSRRAGESLDPLHGERASEYILEIRDEYLEITDDQLEILRTACAFHNKNLTEPPEFTIHNADQKTFERAVITIQTCWDADRLDLPRVGIVINPDRLCTAAARQLGIIREASMRAIERKGLGE